MARDGLSIPLECAQGRHQSLRISVDSSGSTSEKLELEKIPLILPEKNSQNSYKYLYGKIFKTKRTTGRIPERQGL